MNIDVKKIENMLQEVVEKNEDAIKGFRKAAENSKDEALRDYFSNRAEKRLLFLKPLHWDPP